MRLLGWVCRLVLGGLFVYAGYTKLRNPLLFEMAVDTYRLLPAAGVIIVARSLPCLEVLLGILLLVGWKISYVSSFTALLLAGFLLTMGITYHRGIEANCGCFGFGERISPLSLGRDSILLAMAVFLAGYSWWRQSKAVANDK